MAILHKQETNETIVHYFSVKSHIGKKIVYSNCYEKKNKKHTKFSVPVYDEYKHFFSGCDNFNKGLWEKISFQVQRKEWEWFRWYYYGLYFYFCACDRMAHLPIH